MTKFFEDSLKNVYTKCEYSGLNIQSVYQVPKPGSHERVGCYRDPACAVAHITQKFKEGKIDATKFNEALQLIVEDLNLVKQEGKYLVAAPPISAIDPDLSYEKACPWMICEAKNISAAYLKKRQDEEKQKSSPKEDTSSSKGEGEQQKGGAEKKGMYVYTFEADQKSDSKIETQIFGKNLFFDISSIPESPNGLFWMDYQGKKITLLGSTERTGDLQFNKAVTSIFKLQELSFYGTVRVFSPKPLFNGSDIENTTLISLFTDQKKNRGGKNLKTTATEKLIEDFLSSQNISKDDATPTQRPSKKRKSAEQEQPIQDVASC